MDSAAPSRKGDTIMTNAILDMPIALFAVFSCGFSVIVGYSLACVSEMIVNR